MFPKPFCARHLWTWARGIWHDWNAAPANLPSAHHRMRTSNVSPKRRKTMKNDTSMKGQHWFTANFYSALCIILHHFNTDCLSSTRTKPRKAALKTHNLPQFGHIESAKRRDGCLAVLVASPTPPKTNTVDSSNKNTLRNTWQTGEASKGKEWKTNFTNLWSRARRLAARYSLHNKPHDTLVKNERFSNAANHTMSIVQNFGSCTVLRPQIPLALVHSSQVELCDLDFTTDQIIPSQFQFRSLAYQPRDSNTK